MLEKEKFVNYTLDEDKKLESVVLPVRTNKLEQLMIKEIKELLNIHSDSKALKIAARVGLDVLQRTFSSKVLKYLCSEKRERLSDYKVFVSKN